MKKNNKKRNAGFSLIELIAVIAVMAVLAAVAIPIYGSYVEDAALAADETYINECYRAAAVIAAEKGDPLYAISVNADGEILVCHEKEDDEFVFCDGCSTKIAEIIGGMQKLQSDALTTTPADGTTADIAMGTLTYGTVTLEGEGTAAGWVFEVKGSVNSAVNNG